MRCILICVVISCFETVLSFPGRFYPRMVLPEEGFVQAHNEFAIRMYRSLSSKERNFFFCAICVSSSLSLLQEAATRKTSEELNRTLGFVNYTPVEGTVRDFYYFVNHRLWYDSSQFSTNTIFISNRLGLNSKYFPVSFPVYNTYISGVSVMLSPPPKFESTTISNPAFLLNQLTLKMDFSNVFGTESLYFGVFHNYGEVDRKDMIMMLHKKNSVHRIATYSDFRILELHYVGKPRSTIRVWFLLPNRIEGLPDIEAALNVSVIKNISATFHEMPLNISLPMTDITFNLDISKVLQDLGIYAAFSSRDANFAFPLREPMFLYGVQHQTNFVINSSFVSSGTKWVKKSSETDFIVDRPFLFLVVDTGTGLVLHMGRIVELKMPNMSGIIPNV